MEYYEYPTHMLRRTYLAAMRTGIFFDCGICHKVIEWHDELGKLTIDHIIPRSKGGSDEYENLQPAHDTCNKAKGNKEPQLVFEVYRPQPRRKLQNATG